MPIVMEREFIAIESAPGDRFGALLAMNVLDSGDLTISRDGTGRFAFAGA